MNKSILFAAALALAPLPAFSQDASQSQGPQGPRGGDAASVQSRDAASTPMREGFGGRIAQAQTFGQGQPVAQGQGLGQSSGAQAGGGQSYTGEAGERSELGQILDRLSQSNLRDRIETAMEQVNAACGEDFDEFCGDVTPGEGRIAACLHAHEDQLSRRCRSTLFRVGRNVRQTVSNIAEECLNSIRSQCGNAQRVGECVEQHSASLSPSCQTIVAAIRVGAQRFANLRGMAVFSADDRDLGRVVEVNRAPDGRIQSVQLQVGRFLGLGDKVVTIPGDMLQQMGDRIRVRLASQDVSRLPDVRSQGGPQTSEAGIRGPQQPQQQQPQQQQ